MGEGTHECSLDPCLARDKFPLNDDDPSSDAAVVKGVSDGTEVLGQSSVVSIEAVRPVKGEILCVEVRVNFLWVLPGYLEFTGSHHASYKFVPCVA